jgi:hypothetical protein
MQNTWGVGDVGAGLRIEAHIPLAAIAWSAAEASPFCFWFVDWRSSNINSNPEDLEAYQLKILSKYQQREGT